MKFFVKKQTVQRKEKSFPPLQNSNLLHQHTAIDVDYLTGNIV